MKTKKQYQRPQTSVILMSANSKLLAGSNLSATVTNEDYDGEAGAREWTDGFAW